MFKPMTKVMVEEFLAKLDRDLTDLKKLGISYSAEAESLSQSA
jgi:hypothetical protein